MFLRCRQMAQKTLSWEPVAATAFTRVPTEGFPHWESSCSCTILHMNLKDTALVQPCFKVLVTEWKNSVLSEYWLSQLCSVHGMEVLPSQNHVEALLTEAKTPQVTNTKQNPSFDRCWCESMATKSNQIFMSCPLWGSCAFCVSFSSLS